MDEQQWRALSEEILSGMKEWRQAYPNATFREREEAAHERVSRLEAHLVQETVRADERNDWVQGPVDQRPTCPNCGVPLVSRGKRQQVLQSQGGQRINVQRTYGTCLQLGSPGGVSACTLTPCPVVPPTEHGYERRSSVVRCVCRPGGRRWKIGAPSGASAISSG